VIKLKQGDLNSENKTVGSRRGGKMKRAAVDIVLL
jgi:hypothetical protein